MRQWLRSQLASLYKHLHPKVDQSQTIKALSSQLEESRAREDQYRADYVERASELVEARQMAGAGPWLVAESRSGVDTPGAKLRESDPITSTGAFGDISLALENMQWRREVNLAWLEFSRWGIQIIILISRLYYIKNPIIRRLIDISAFYVFGRGVEVSSPDEAANDVLKEFFERNNSVLGQVALVELEKRKYYDGNLFFAFFADIQNKGLVSVRTIDATEIMDIICDPDDSDYPQYYRRSWTQRIFDSGTGNTSTHNVEAWYPALKFAMDTADDPSKRLTVINGLPVQWESPVHHRKCGGVAKWHFGCPLIYPALDWARNAKRYLEACLTVRMSLSQISMTLTTKGGQQAIQGAKGQLQTTAGPGAQSYDTNPTAVSGSIFASGPGTVLSAFNSKGAGGDPEEVRRYLLMCCMVVGVPETFLADVSTGNLATATTLDRPTELSFLEKQEAWREDLLVISKFVLSVSKGAPSGKLRESHGSMVTIRETRRVRSRDGRRMVDAKESPKAGEVIVSVNFPNILEGDVPAMVGALTGAMTLGNKGGQVVGIDEKAGVRKLYDLVGIDEGDELTEEQYPEGEYDPDRTKELLPTAIARAVPTPGGQPQPDPNNPIAPKLVQPQTNGQG